MTGAMLVVRLPPGAASAAWPPCRPVKEEAHEPKKRTFQRSSTVGSVASTPAPAPPSCAPRPPADERPTEVPMPPYAVPSDDVDGDLARLYHAMHQARRIAVVCGAGISVAAPAYIPDFRSAAGLFAQLKARFPDAGLSSGKDLFDARLFQSESSTSLFYAMMAELKDLASAAQPTLFHHLLKRLDAAGRLQRVYTQNIDGLEGKVGLTFGTGEPVPQRPRTKRARTQRAWQRSQSDSAVPWHPKDEPGSSASPRPLFPRAIPLHGSLATMSCALCSHVLPLDPERDARAGAAMAQLRNGEPVSCERCETADQLRTEAGLRSRGVGRMKMDVVLYHGENDSAEQVGACVERDLLGLRDPHEPAVPETPAEARARERRERQAEPPPASLTLDAASAAPDDVLARAFADDGPAPSDAETAPPRPRRLKAMPPDLLIVAGTSLKVPGTKRIVREFAKACRARDRADKHPRPVRTVYINYDFPSAASEWAGVFDMWVQGDVQHAALGLSDPAAPPSGDAGLEALVAEHSWAKLVDAHLTQRSAPRRAPVREPATAPATAPAAPAPDTASAPRSAASRAPPARRGLEAWSAPSRKLSTTRTTHGKLAHPARSSAPSASRS